MHKNQRNGVYVFVDICINNAYGLVVQVVSLLNFIFREKSGIDTEKELQ